MSIQEAKEHWAKWTLGEAEWIEVVFYIQMAIMKRLGDPCIKAAYQRFFAISSAEGWPATGENILITRTA
jgi:hypothetical protein